MSALPWSATSTDPIAQLAPIGLEELVEQAALLTRVDRKYVLGNEALDVVLGELGPATRALEIDGRRAQRYRSTYLDTADLTSFHAAGRGRRLRWKVRTRDYLDTGESYLEVKSRGPRGTTVKERVLTAGAGDEQQRLLHARLGAAAAALIPTLENSYLRSTLLLDEGSRATIDRRLRLQSHLAPGRHARVPQVILETKSGSTPGELDRLLWRHGHRPVRISKYGAGLALLHPELPRMKWHRALDRSLAAPRGAA